MMAGYCVDYLSYKWEADDLIQTYRETRKQSADSIDNKHDEYKLKRLQNALWREMARKCTPNLSYPNKLVDPSSMCWQKESDITWLYGPIYTITQTQISRPPNPLYGVKPVLKKQYPFVQPCLEDIWSLRYHSTSTSLTSSRSSSFSSISTSSTNSSTSNGSSSNSSSSSSTIKTGVHFNPEIIEIEYQPEYPVSPTSFPFLEEDASTLYLFLSLIKTLTLSTVWLLYQRFYAGEKNKKN
ncbi:unnamed protein product [Rhizopus stolonifer]